MKATFLILRDIEQALDSFKRIQGADADTQIVPARSPDAGPSDARGTRGHTFRYSVPLGYWQFGFTTNRNT